MSRGLGQLQRAILAGLEPAMAERIGYRGNGRWSAYPDRGWVVASGCLVRVRDDVFDLRAVIKYLAIESAAITHCSFVSGRFQASFSRAVASLIRRSLIKSLWLVPVVDVDPYLAPRQRARLLALSDGMYLQTAEKQARFITLIATEAEKEG